MDASAPNSSLSKLSIDRAATTPRQGLRHQRPWWKRWWFWLVAALVVGLLLTFVVRQSREIAVEIGTVAAAYPSQAVTVLNATGRVVAARRASVSSKGTGRLEWLGVQEGQRVTEGDVIARLENRDVAAQREQAAANVEAARANLTQGEADLADAEAALGRSQELAQQSFVSASAVDTARARANSARARIQTLRAQIRVAQANLRAADVSYEQTLIRAPFTGMVLTKSANVGDIVTPFSSASGTTGAVVTMADMSTLEVEADVSENAIAKIEVNQPAEIQLDAFPELRLLAKVSRIVPTVDRSKATLLVKLHFEEQDARVLPDMSARIAFLSRALQPDERKPVAALRPEAIVKRDGKDVVFVVRAEADKTATNDHGNSTETAALTAAERGGRVELMPVTTTNKLGDLVRVENFAVGTPVVINPPPALQPGRVVTPQKK